MPFHTSELCSPANLTSEALPQILFYLLRTAKGYVFSVYKLDTRPSHYRQWKKNHEQSCAWDEYLMLITFASHTR